MEKLKRIFRRTTPQFDIDENLRYYEPEYRQWWSWEVLDKEFCALSQNGFLNSLFSLMVLAMLVLAITETNIELLPLWSVDFLYNVWYGVVVASVAAAARRYPAGPVTVSMKDFDEMICLCGIALGCNAWYALIVSSVNAAVLGFLMDFVSYLHYLPFPHRFHCIVICYFIRVHRPLRFIWATDNNTMNSSLLVTSLKYMYYSLLLRIVCAYFWIVVNYLDVGMTHATVPQRRMLHAASPLVRMPDLQANSLNQSRQLITALYVVNKIFIPIGPAVNPKTDFDRVLFLLVMMTGVLLVTGAAVAALSSVISLHMRPEESFRARYRIIMHDLTSSGIPISLRNKVETFYKMYWHKQRAVSATQLLPSFPPVLPKSVYTDIYFEATQKSGLLRDLSYQFLSEIAKNMETILYIPGDSIIKRNSPKHSIIYITYGDIEMLTAEDDISPMLRFTRGTILTPWGALCGRAHVALRAATFCAAHALPAPALWRAARMSPGLAPRMLAQLTDHMDKVKRHYAKRTRRPARYKSSILEFKKSLMALKEARDANGELLLARPDYFLEIAGCYLMRNRADATLRDDSDAICLRQTFPCILQPTSSLLTAWNWLVAGLIVVVCFTYPYYLIYKKTIPLEFRFFDLMVTVIYVLDMIVYLSTGANVEEGVPITFLQTSSLQVQSPWFVLDVLGTFPIFTFVDEGQFAGLNKVFRFPKVIRVIQSLEEECVYHSNVVRFISYALMLIIACYFLAALQQVFVCYGYGYCLVTNFTHEPFWTKEPLDDATVSDRLCFSLYWAISVLTFTSHMELGGALEKDYTVHMYTTLLLEVCIVMHICIEAVYSATIMVTTAFRENFDSCIADVRNFLIHHNVAPQLRQRFIEHLLLCWNTRKAYTMASQQSTVFYDLPAHVYHDILARQRSKYILSIPFMKLLYKEDLKNVLSNARLFYTAPHEILLNTGDITTEVFVIKQGFCEVLNPETEEVVGTLIAKNHFGVLECLFRFPAFYTVRAATHVQVFSISRKHLVQAFEIPQIKDAMNFAKEQEEYSRLQVRREPFVFYQPPAPAPNREHFKLPRKHERDSAFLQPFKKLGFFSIFRHMFPRFTFRPDSELLTSYEICRAFCAFACVFVFPSYTYLVLQFPWLYHVASVLDLFAYSDIVFRMLVGYFDANGILIYHPANTAAHYLRGAFLMDTFSCLPLENLEVSGKYYYGKLYQVTAMKQVLMMNRLLQLYRLPGTLEVVTSRIERRDLIVVLQALPIFLTVLNLLTSLLAFSSVRIYHSVDEREWAFIPTNDKGGSWIHLFHEAYRFNVTATPWELHLGCYFWIVYEATTTGYNTIAPTNLHIMTVLFSAMVFGSLIMIYMSVRIISIRANVNNTLAAYQEHIKDLVQFMQREKFDKQLQKEMTDHYEFNWAKTGGVDARNVLKLCDQSALRSDAILHLYGPAFANCPILADCDVSLLRVLGRTVRSIHFLAGTTVYHEDDIVEQLYIVYSGELHLRITHWEDKTCSIQKLAIGSMVGNLDDTPGMRASSRLVAATDVHLLQMSSAAFHHVVRYCDSHVVYQLIAKYRAHDEPFIDADASKSWPSPSRRSSNVAKTFNFNSSIAQVAQVFVTVISMLCVYIDLYNAGFQDNRLSVIVVLYVLDTCFLVKILVCGVLPELLILPTDEAGSGPKKTYFKSAEFKYDVASCAPIELFCLLSKEPGLLLSWLRLNRMLRINTVSKYLKRYQKRATENLVLSTLALVMWFTLFVHCCACLWFFVGLVEHRAAPRSSWFYDDNGEPLCNSKYICSAYFVLTTFSQNGVNDVMPKKQLEVLYVSVLSITSTMVYVVYVGEFANIVQYASFRAFSYSAKCLELREFLKNNRVSRVLVDLVNKYSVLLWRAARGEQLPVFLVNAPLCLKLKVMSRAYLHEIKQPPVFRDCEPALLRQVVGHLRQYYYDENMYVVQQNEITNSMYFVHTGEVLEISEFHDENASTAHVKRVLYTAGEYFGVAEGLVRDKPFRYSYRTTIESQILTLRLEDWEYLLKHFPDSKRVIDSYQWTSRSDGGDDPAPEGDEAPRRDLGGIDIDNLKLSRSELGLVEGLPKSVDGSSSEPTDSPLNEPSDGASKSLSFMGLKRKIQKYYSKLTLKNLQSRTHTGDKTILPDISESTQSVKPEAKDTKIEEDVTSNSNADLLGEASKKTIVPKRKSVVWAPKRMTKLSETSFEESLELDVSSSAQLFKRIRNAAMAVDRAANQHDTSQSSLKTEDSEADVVNEPQQSVEEYLAYKYKMKESYSLDAYTSKREDVIKNDNTAVRRSSRAQTPIEYMHKVVDHPSQDFRRTQLAETSRDGSSKQSLIFSSVDLGSPLSDPSPHSAPAEEPLNMESLEPERPAAEALDLLQKTTSVRAIVIPPDHLALQRVDSKMQAPSNQTTQQSDETSSKNDTKAQRINADSIANADSKIKLVDFDSDVAAVMKTLSTPTELTILRSLSDTLEHSQPSLQQSSVPNNALIPFKTSPPEQADKQGVFSAKELGENSKPKSEKETQRSSVVGENVMSGITLVDFDSDVAAVMKTLPTPTERTILRSLSDTLEHSQPSLQQSSVPNNALIPFKTSPPEQADKQGALSAKELGENSKPKSEKETQRSSVVGENVMSGITLVDFDSDVAAQMAAAAGVTPVQPVELSALHPVQPVLPEPESTSTAHPEPPTPPAQHDPNALPAITGTPPAQDAPSSQLYPALAALHEILSDLVQSTIPEQPERPALSESPAQSELPTLLKQPTSLEPPNDTLESIQLLLEETATLLTIFTNPEDQVTDLAALPPEPVQVERIDSQVPTSSKQVTQQLQETPESRAKEMQSTVVPKSDFKEKKLSIDSPKTSKGSDEDVSDQEKGSDEKK